MSWSVDFQAEVGTVRTVVAGVIPPDEPKAAVLGTIAMAESRGLRGFDTLEKATAWLATPTPQEER